MPNKRFGCLGLGLVILLALSIVVNVVCVFAMGSRSGKSMLPPEVLKFDETLVAAPLHGVDAKIIVLSLRGIIASEIPGALGETMVDDLKMQLRQAADDANVKAVVIAIDSPGGEVTASDVIYNAVREFRAKKPVVISMGSVAASGGYYVACGGSWLIANETTFTGSIGVIMQALNYQSLFDKVGLQFHTFKSGKFKDMLSGSRPITDEEKTYVQGLVMQTYGKFVGIVAKERELPEEDLRNGVADGRVLSGKDALEAKLIHQLGSVEDAYAKAMELGQAPGAAVIRYDAGFKLGKLFKLLGMGERAKIEVQLPQTLAPKVEAGRLYYLPSFYVP